MTRKYHRDPSMSEANSAALYGRDRTYSTAHQMSVTVSQDYRKRQPRDLREAVKMCRALYADEVPTKLHSGTELADDGTPAMTNRATSYIFGNPSQTDAGRNDGEFLSYYVAPFRATLAGMQGGHDCDRSCPAPDHRRAAIVSHITVGSQGPQEAAIAEGVPLWAAKTVAEDAIRSFLRRLSDVRVDTRPEVAA
jgi:hypothetical protein